VVGLGNPGIKYENTRHNIGFMVLDRLVSWGGASVYPPKKKSSYLSMTGIIAGVPVILVKPLTFMNRSGEAVNTVLRYYEMPLERLLVIHDDLDIPVGQIKFVSKGGAAGHNGVRSIIKSLGSREFSRLKIGIGRPDSPVPIEKYVLSGFLPVEAKKIEKVIELAAEGVVCFLEHGIDRAMNRFNGAAISEDDT